MNNQTNQSYWSKFIKPKIIEIFKNNESNLINKELITKFEKLTNDCKQILREYNQLKNSKFSLFKKREINHNLKLLKIKYQQAKLKKVTFHKEIIDSIDFLKFFSLFDDVIEYKHMGPVPISLIKQIKNFKSSYLLDSDFSNPLNTSWGIFDKNKIIFHKAKQILHKERSGLVPNDEINLWDIKIERFRYSYTLMESCPNLQFYFYDESWSKTSKKFNEEYNYQPLDNPLFEQKYNWYRNNEIEFRMLFTPLTQEKFLKDDINFRSTPDFLKWTKKRNFLYNRYNNIDFNFSKSHQFNKTIINFLTNPDTTIKQLKNNILNDILNYFLTIYYSINFMWLGGVLKVEDHSHIIQEAIRDKNKINSDNIVLYSHYILNDFFNYEIIRIDTDCFNEVNNIEDIIKINGIKGYKVSVKGTSFERVVEKSGSRIIVYFKPHIKNVFLYFMPIAKDIYYSNIKNIGVFTNIQDKNILNIINKINEKGFIKIKYNLLGILVRDSNELQNEVEQLLKLI